VLSHLRLVVAVARGYLGYGLPHADLIQEGNIGLMKAVKRFDPERGVRLVSFAIHWIKAEIHEYILRNWRMVKVGHDQGAKEAVLQSALDEDRPRPADSRRHQARGGRATRQARGSGRDGEAPLRAGDRVEADDDDEDSYARRNTSPTTKPSRSACWRPKNRRACRPPACRSARQSRPAQAPHHRGALAEGKRQRDAARPRRRVSTSRPSASARSRPRRWRRCASDRQSGRAARRCRSPAGA